MPTPSNSNQDLESAEWFYQLLGLATGPVSVDRLKWLIEQNHLTGASMIGLSQKGPWERLDKSPLAHLVGSAPKAEAKKKPVRISSGRKGSSKKLPKLKSQSAPPSDEAEYVSDGIEIEDLEVVEEPVIRKPARPAGARQEEARSKQTAIRCGTGS